MRNLRAGCAALLLCALALALGCSRGGEGAGEFRIGVIAPLGLPERFTAHLLAQARVDEINAQGGLLVGGRKLKVRLVVADSGAQVEQAMGVMGRLIQQDHVSAIIGPFYSREAIPVAAALERLQVPMLTPSATNPEVTRGRSFAFRVCMSDSEQGRSLARYAYEELGLRRIAVLYDESDAYSSDLADAFRRAFAGLPGASLHMEGYPGGEKDFSVRLARIRAGGTQALLLPNFPRDLSGQMQQARAAGFRGLFLGGDSWDSDPAFHSLPEAQGAFYTSDFCQAAADPQRLAGARSLAAKAGVDLDKVGATTLDALDLLLAAAQQAGSTDPVSLRSSLAVLRDFRGLTGDISYAGGGDPVHSVCVMGISGGKAALRMHLPAQGGR